MDTSLAASPDPRTMPPSLQAQPDTSNTAVEGDKFALSLPNSSVDATVQDVAALSHRRGQSSASPPANQNAAAFSRTQPEPRRRSMSDKFMMFAYKIKTCHRQGMRSALQSRLGGVWWAFARSMTMLVPHAPHTRRSAQLASLSICTPWCVYFLQTRLGSLCRLQIHSHD